MSTPPTPPSDHLRGATTGSSQRPPREVTGSVLEFDLATELATLQQEPSWQRNDRNARTLVEDGDVRLVLTALKLGARLSPHQTSGWVSVHVTDGRLRVTADGREIDLPMGHVLVLARNERHAVEAIEDSAFLLTVAGLGRPD
jgi:quercetin dioxygenase-like cupin family protein